MYRVYAGNYLLYHSNHENLQIFEPSLELEINKTGSFEFTIFNYPPYFSLLQKLKTIITVWQDDFLLFRGRIFEENIGFHNEKTVICEGDLAFLLDSVQRPMSFSGTAAELLSLYLDSHNAQVDEDKRFAVGNVTVSGTFSVDEKEYLNTSEALQKSILTASGAYIRTRYEGGTAYIDLLSEISLLSPQKIIFGKNLLDLKRIRKSEDIATVIIPLGDFIKDENGEETDQRLTVASVNGGADYFGNSEAIAQFGRIVKTVIFDGISDPAELLAAGQAYLAESVKQYETIELTAADLAAVDKTVTSFHLGTLVDVLSDPHGINQRFEVTKLSMKLFDPASNKLTLGKVVRAFSDAVSGISTAQRDIVRAVDKSATEARKEVYNVERNLQSAIEQSAENITAKVAESYYLKDETEALISSVSTEIEQTKNSVEIRFEQFAADVEAVASGTDAEFEEIRKYIRFVDGKILLGEIGNELELQISNDRISFLQDGAEVAYFSDRKLYVTDGQYTHSLQIGNFAFMPRENGNLSFKKTT